MAHLTPMLSARCCWERPCSIRNGPASEWPFAKRSARNIRWFRRRVCASLRPTFSAITTEALQCSQRICASFGSRFWEDPRAARCSAGASRSHLRAGTSFFSLVEEPPPPGRIFRDWHMRRCRRLIRLRSEPRKRGYFSPPPEEPHSAPPPGPFFRSRAATGHDAWARAISERRPVLENDFCRAPRPASDPGQRNHALRRVPGGAFAPNPPTALGFWRLR